MGSLLSCCCSLLSSLLSPLCSLSGRYGVKKGWLPSGGFIAGPRADCSGLSALLSLLSSFCCLLSLLAVFLCRCHSFLRSKVAPAPFDLRIGPPTSPATASTLCGSLPGPAECAKRLNNNKMSADQEMPLGEEHLEEPSAAALSSSDGPSSAAPQAPPWRSGGHS